MNCPYCSDGRTGIFKTRPMPNSTVLRERRCLERGCRAQLVTIEMMRASLGMRVSVAQVRKRRSKP